MIDPGSRLDGRYRIVRLLGEGGMGAVYEAEHEGIGRRVALKVLHERYRAKDQAVARFVREAQAAGGIGHENIVEVLDFGTHQGLPFIVMEYLKGETLAERLAGEPMPSSAACRIAGQVLSALAAAHARGIVHRDLKPENVFVLRQANGRDVVKLLDFGISKFRRPGGKDNVVTEDGAFMGTPAYMAPEQWMGRRDVDHRADLFSAGVMLYEILTGGLPFEGETQGALFLEVVQGTTEPPRPSEIAPGVPHELDDIVLRALRRDRDARYSCAQEFLDALRPHGAQEIEAIADPPMTAIPDDTPLPARRLDARARTVASTAAEESTVARVPVTATSATTNPRARRALRSLVAATVLIGALVAGYRTWMTKGTRPRGNPAGAAMDAHPTATTAHAPAPAETIVLELRGLPAGATVTVDGQTREGARITLPRSNAEHAIELWAGAAHRSLTIRADRDQALVVDLTEPIAATPVVAAATHEATAGPRTVRRTRGARGLGVTHEF